MFLESRKDLFSISCSVELNIIFYSRYVIIVSAAYVCYITRMRLARQIKIFRVKGSRKKSWVKLNTNDNWHNFKKSSLVFTHAHIKDYFKLHHSMPKVEELKFQNFLQVVSIHKFWTGFFWAIFCVSREAFLIQW